MEFPKLRTIELQPSLSLWPPDVYNLISVAPNLRTVTGTCWLDDAERNNCKRLDVFTHITVMPYEELDEAFELLAFSRPKLNGLRIFDTDDSVFPRSWSPLLRQLIKQCAFTLQRMSLCATEFLDLKKEQLVLHALEFLELFLPDDSTIEEFHEILGALNLQALCPNVKSLRITLGQDHCIHEIPASLPVYSNHCAIFHSVRHFMTENPQCPVAVVEACLSSFPMLLSFGFELIACAEICEDMRIEHLFELHKIWTGIPTLEELKICLVSPKKSPEPHSLDALLCGLSVHEISSIKENYGPNKTSLQNFEYCALRPSVLYGKSKYYKFKKSVTPDANKSMLFSDLKRVSLVVSPNYRPKALCMPDVCVPLVFSGNPALRLQITSYCSRISAGKQFHRAAAVT